MTITKDDIVEISTKSFDAAGGDVNLRSLVVINSLIGSMIRGAAVAQAIRDLKGEPTTTAGKAGSALFDKAMGDFKQRLVVYQTVTAALDGKPVYVLGQEMTPSAVASMLGIDTGDMQSYFMTHVVGAILAGETASPNQPWGKTYGPEITMPMILAEMAANIPRSPSTAEIYIGKARSVAAGIVAGGYSFIVGNSQELQKYGAQAVSTASEAVTGAKDFMFESVESIREFASEGASGLVEKEVNGLFATAKEEISKELPDLVEQVKATVRGEARAAAASGAKSSMVPILIGAGVIALLVSRR